MTKYLSIQDDLIVQLITLISLISLLYLSISKGIRISKKYAHIISDKPLYKSRNSFITFHNTKKGGRGIVYVFDDCVMFYSSFMLLFLADETGLLKKIEITEIEEINLFKFKWLFFFFQNRIMISLKNGEKYSIKVNNNNHCFNLIQSLLKSHR